MIDHKTLDTSKKMNKVNLSNRSNNNIGVHS